MELRDTCDFIANGAGPAGEAATELAAFFAHSSAAIEKNKLGRMVTTTGVVAKALRELALYVNVLRLRYAWLANGGCPEYCRRVDPESNLERMSVAAARHHPKVATPNCSWAYKYAAFDSLRGWPKSETEKEQ